MHQLQIKVLPFWGGILIEIRESPYGHPGVSLIALFHTNAIVRVREGDSEVNLLSIRRSMNEAFAESQVLSRTWGLPGIFLQQSL